MAKKSVVGEARQIQMAIELINLGARLQVLEAETTLSRERLLRLYKEVKGVSPPKGKLPFSTDWFITWQPNIHSSLFIEIYRYLQTHSQVDGIEATIKAYRLSPIREMRRQGLCGSSIQRLRQAVLWTYFSMVLG